MAWLEAPKTWLKDSEAQSGGGDGRTDGEIFPYCTGLASPPVPSGAAAQKANKQRVTTKQSSLFMQNHVVWKRSPYLRY